MYFLSYSSSLLSISFKVVHNLEVHNLFIYSFSALLSFFCEHSFRVLGLEFTVYGFEV